MASKDLRSALGTEGSSGEICLLQSIFLRQQFLQGHDVVLYVRSCGQIEQAQDHLCVLFALCVLRASPPSEGGRTTQVDHRAFVRPFVRLLSCLLRGLCKQTY